ncbi:MAG: hypothetical protein ACI87E_001828 [Mariniblastus sp.]|jgi:hypothetical protein
MKHLKNIASITRRLTPDHAGKTKSLDPFHTGKDKPKLNLREKTNVHQVRYSGERLNGKTICHTPNPSELNAKSSRDNSSHLARALPMHAQNKVIVSVDVAN